MAERHEHSAMRPTKMYNHCQRPGAFYMSRQGRTILIQLIQVRLASERQVRELLSLDLVVQRLC